MCLQRQSANALLAEEVLQGPEARLLSLDAELGRGQELEVG